VVKALLILALLGLAVAASKKYGYPDWKKYRDLLARVPGLEQSVTAVSSRMDAAEGHLRAWAGDRKKLDERMTKIENRLQENLRAARQQAQELGSQLQHRLQLDLHQRNEAMQARLREMESAQEADRARLARLQEEMAAVRRDTTQQIAAVRQETGSDAARLDQQLVALNQQVDRGRQDIDQLAHTLERRRIDFELSRNRSRELAPGITLTLTRTNAAYRRFSGRLWLLPDRRTLWMRDRGVQEPVVFYSKHDNRPYELVITQVTREGVAGYLLQPVKS
jgi:chromosome segregation ATPase